MSKLAEPEASLQCALIDEAPSPVLARPSPPSSPLPVCVLAVCVPRVRGRRVGVSACRRVGVCVGVLVRGNRPYPDIPVFF